MTQRFANRRHFLKQAGALALASMPIADRSAQAVSSPPPSPPQSFFDLLRVPDSVTAYSQLNDPRPLTRSGTSWNGNGIDLHTDVAAEQLAIAVHAPQTPLSYIHMRWSLPVSSSLIVLGDHWERSYGDLGWRNIIPERVMPWYFTTHDGRHFSSYGVKTGARSLCFWQLDPQGVSLWMNLCNGGSGVRLGERTLDAATIVARKGSEGESPTEAIRSFCRTMCSKAALPFQPVYGTNDWYYAYGNNTAAQIIGDTEFIANLSTGNAVRPFSVIDMGWAVGPPKFPSMTELSKQIRSRDVRPGIWIRPLEAPASTNPSLLLPDQRFGRQKDRARELAYDPTIPEAMEEVLKKVKQVVDWEFDLVKHDFSTYDLLGRWGSEMGAEPTTPGWSLHDSSRTNAEIILDLYRQIRSACRNETVILGCNTIGHLAQGYFDAQRTGDDTSGKVWERTRRMGVNTLAFRLPQHGTFFIQDADCVGISAGIPWQLNRQWLNLLAQSGTALFVSPGEGSRGTEQAQAIKDAFRLTASGKGTAQPSDALNESTPQRWFTHHESGHTSSKLLEYKWSMNDGTYPFGI